MKEDKNWMEIKNFKLSGQCKPGEVVPARVSSMDQIEDFNHLLRTIMISYLK